MTLDKGCFDSHRPPKRGGFSFPYSFPYAMRNMKDKISEFRADRINEIVRNHIVRPLDRDPDYNPEDTHEDIPLMVQCLITDLLHYLEDEGYPAGDIEDVLSFAIENFKKERRQEGPPANNPRVQREESARQRQKELLKEQYPEMYA